jgi:hypothetical protein
MNSSECPGRPLAGGRSAPGSSGPPSRWLSFGGPLVVAYIGLAWVWLGGAPTAQLLRRGFALLRPTVFIAVGAALVVVAIGVELVPAGLRRRIARRTVAVRRSVGRTPTSVVLTAIVVVAFVLRAALGAANHTPKVLGDELIYVGLAKGWALHAEPLLRGSLSVGNSTFYPLLLAPVFRLSANGAAALQAVRVVNAMLMALTAVPVFVLARRVVPRRWALGVAALSVAAPWTAYSALAMTESLFYPVFVTYVAVLIWTFARPSIFRQLVSLSLLVVLVGVRAQGLSVAVGTAAAIVALGALEGEVGIAIRRFWPTLGVYAGGLSIGVVAAATGVVVPTSNYNAVFSSLTGVGGMLKWGAWNAALFGLAVGAVAFAAFPVALRAMLQRSARPAAHVTAVVSLTVSLSLLGSVALLSASPYGLDILHERNLFYVTPLILTCLAYWLSAGMPRPLWFSVASAAALVGLAAFLSPHIASSTNDVDGPSAYSALLHLPHTSFRVSATAFAILGAAIFLFARRPLLPILTVVLAFAAIVSQVDYRDTLTAGQANALAWLDHALPRGASADLVYLGVPYGAQPCASVAAAEQQDLTTWTEFFNIHIRSVTHVYAPNARDELASPQLTIGARGFISENGKPFKTTYLIIDSRQKIVGKRLARFDLLSIDSQYQQGSALTLWRVDPPLRFYPLPSPLPPRGDGQNCF